MSLRTTWRKGDKFLIRHKDADILLVDKKAGVLTHTTPSGRVGLGVLEDLRNMFGYTAVRPIHRLDRAVSGLLVFARNPRAEAHLLDQFRTKTAIRTYVAAIKGILPQETGTLEGWLTTEPIKVRSANANPRAQKKWAVTHYRVLEQIPTKRVTLVEVQLETGLRNQIRVQFQEAGHPLLGDRKYGEASKRAGLDERVFLHARELSLIHPRTGRPVTFTSPLPKDLTSWWQLLLGNRDHLGQTEEQPRRPRRKRRQRA